MQHEKYIRHIPGFVESKLGARYIMNFNIYMKLRFLYFFLFLTILPFSCRDIKNGEIKVVTGDFGESVPGIPLESVPGISLESVPGIPLKVYQFYPC